MAEKYNILVAGFNQIKCGCAIEYFKWRVTKERNSQFIKPRYRFKNKVTNEEIYVTIPEFILEYNANRSNLSKVFNGKLKSINKWYLIK